jgi:hypothetical protein
MKINLVCVEDGIIALGFRKMSAVVKSVNADTRSFYVPLSRRSMWNRITAREHERNAEPFAARVGAAVAHADVVAFSSMSDYAPFVKAVIREVRRQNPRAYVVWGGVHPIIVPEDAVQHADAICTGEGEFAFRELHEKLEHGRDATDTRNFWFNSGGTIVKNGFLPLMSGEEMSGLPLLEYANGDELIFDRSKGFVPYMIPPAYDIIVDNPVETKEDVDATLRLLYEMPRPFTLNLFALRVTPNTEMAKQFERLGMRPRDIAEGYFGLVPTLANALVYLLAVCRLARFLFEWWIKKAEPLHLAQKLYPRLNQVLRALYFVHRGTNHLRQMDFSHSPGKAGFVLYKLGIIAFWRKHLVRKYRPTEPPMIRLPASPAARRT